MLCKSVLLILVASLCASSLGFSWFGTSRQPPEIRTLPADTMYINSGSPQRQVNQGELRTIHENGETFLIDSQGNKIRYTQGETTYSSTSGSATGIHSSSERQQLRSQYEHSGPTSTTGGSRWFGGGNSGSVDTRHVVRSQDLETQHNDLRLHGYDGTPFSFTLKEPLFDKISREQASNYREPGWTITDSHNREVDVNIDIPLDMRRQRPGLYDITYTAYLRTGSPSEPLGIQRRQVQVYNVNQCEDGTHDCSKHAYCFHLETGGYRCECKPGYRGTGQSCQDIDECAEGLAVCDIHSTCQNTQGSYECRCNAGFIKVGDVCEDIDECASGSHDCSPNAYCKNLPGSFTCKCKEGFEGNGRICNPINKCDSGEINCHPYADCLVLPNGEFKCECREGFRGDGVITCEDIDECREGLVHCPDHSHCRNTFGSYQCVCDPGFQKGRGGLCEDIDECALGMDDCGIHARCYNTIGGYNCECLDGYVRNEAGRCESITGNPELTLKGPNPMSILLFDTYSEPGFLLEEEREEMSLIVRIPPQLHGTARHCGRFDIIYVAKDLATGKETTRTRTVFVEEIDQCKLPENHPFSHKCNEYARCVFLPGQCDYTCQCPPGYDGNGFGPDGCKDTVPPVLVYNGPEPFVREVCRVCGTIIAEPNLSEPVITKAYDNTPNGPKDISDRIRLTTEPSPEDDCIIHIYSVHDDSGNVATRRLTVCVRVEDMRTTIMEMKAMYTWQMWLIRNVAFLCALAFLLFCVWEFGHYIASCFRVYFDNNPTHDDFDTAYSLWYRMTRPLASRADIRTLVNQKILLRDDGGVSDEEVNDTYQYESDEEFESDDE